MNFEHGLYWYAWLHFRLYITLYCRLLMYSAPRAAHVVAWTCNATCILRVLIRMYVYSHLKHDTSQKYSVTVGLFCSSAVLLYCRCVSLTGLAELWEDTDMADSHWLYRDWHCRRTREHTVHSLHLPCCADSSVTTWTRILHIIIIIIIINDNVYGAVIVTTVTTRVHPVHLMNADWAYATRHGHGTCRYWGGGQKLSLLEKNQCPYLASTILVNLQHNSFTQVIYILLLHYLGKQLTCIMITFINQSYTCRCTV